MPTARPDGLDPGEVARMLAGAVERQNDPVRPDDMDALRAEHAHLSEVRRAMLDAGLDLTWEIHIPRDEIPAPGDDLADCEHGCNGDCLISGSEVCSFTCHSGREDDEDVRAYVSRLWAEDWNSLEDQAYDRL